MPVLSHGSLLVHGLVQLINRYGLISIFISHVIENLGLPFPTEGAFLVSQRLIEAQSYSFWFMYVFMVGAQVLGAIVAYWLGRSVDRWLQRRFADHTEFQRAQASVKKWYGQYGSVTVLATRLIGYVRPWSSLIAGAASFPFLPFLIWTIIGTMLFVYPTMKITSVVFLLWRYSPITQLLVSLLFLIGFFGLLIYALVRRVKRSG